MYHFLMTTETCTTTLPPPINNNGYDYVDLGLPSGTLWATMNVGASKPEDYGLYFQWGDTSGYTAEQVGTGEGQKKFADNYRDYKWGQPTLDNYFRKYKFNGLTTLELEDDAAHVNMGGDWHMPTSGQCQELIDNTTTALTTSDGVSGIAFTSKKDTSKFIFIPMAGQASEGSVIKISKLGIIFSSMLSSRNDNRGLVLYCNRSESLASDVGRCLGCSIRGVIG